MTNCEDKMWREGWARYFDARAAKSRRNGEAYPQHKAIWNDKALVEEECAIVLRMADRTLPELLAALDEPGKPSA